MKMFGFKNPMYEFFFSIISILLVCFVFHSLFTAMYRAKSGFSHIDDNLADQENFILIGGTKIHDIAGLRRDISDWKYFKRSGSHPTQMFEVNVCQPKCNLVFVLYRDSRDPRMYWVSLTGGDLKDYIGYIETDLVKQPG